LGHRASGVPVETDPKGAKQMFESFEELTRFGESARKVLFKSIARWTAASAIAALWIQTFLYAFLPAE
jgi:hypothetical protein